VDKEKPTAERVNIHWIFFDMIFLSSQPGKDMYKDIRKNLIRER